MNQEIGILGGTGFLGSRLVSALAADGYRVRVPSRNVALHRHLQVLPTVRMFQCDIHDPGTLRDLVAGCTIVINLVGILNEKGRNGAGFRAAHTELTQKLVNACQLGHVAKHIQISALKASAENGPSHYLRTKGEAEQIIMEQSGATAWTILQPSVIFGPGDSFTNRFAGLLRLMPVIFPLAKPDSLFAPVHVDDVVLAIRKVMHNKASDGRTYQLYGAEAYSLRELVIRISQSIGERRYVWGLPDWLARLQAMSMEFLPGKPFSLDNYRSLGVPSVGTEDGLEQLGIKPRSLDLNLDSCIGQLSSQTPLDRRRRIAGR
jgi:NADH dehydrogenase